MQKKKKNNSHVNVPFTPRMVFGLNLMGACRMALTLFALVVLLNDVINKQIIITFSNYESGSKCYKPNI